MQPSSAHLHSQQSTPTEEDAAAIFRGFIGREATDIRRFPTGLAHHVFDVTADAEKWIVRIASSDDPGAFGGAIYWSNLLRPLGVPLPRILHGGSHGGFQFLVLERLAGTDLGHVYGGLSSEQKRGIAVEIARIQERVSELPVGSGYGYVNNYEDQFPHSTWRSAVEANLKRSRGRIEATAVADLAVAHRVERWLDSLDNYLRAVRPQPFLDDTTTKNVICDDGRLSGIVDVDQVCFGDPLYTPALTRAALLADGHVTDYIDYWLEQLRPDKQQLAAFHLYTAVFCLDLISETGQTFNRIEAIPVDMVRLGRLSAVLEQCLSAG